MSLRAALAAARARLHAGGIEDAGLEGELLLRHALGYDRAQFYAHLEDDLDAASAERYEGYLSRRLAHEPSAYITGRREFCSLDLQVTPATLIPRPETETLVEAALDIARASRVLNLRPLIADIGTGCGAIAIAIARGLPAAQVYAVDSSAEAIKVAEANARRHDVAGQVIFWQGDLLTPLPEPVDLIVANLPYVASPDIEDLAPEVRDHEPRAALDGGADGLDVIGRLLRAAPELLKPGGSVCLEFGEGQEAGIVMLATRYFPNARGYVRRDLAGKPRCLVIF